MIELLADLALSGLLLVTAAWCALLHRRLRRLGTERGEMEAFIAALGQATERAETAIAGLREAAVETEARLREQGEAARQRGGELARLVESGARLARRLEVGLGQGAKGLAAAAPLSPPARGEPVAARPVRPERDERRPAAPPATAPRSPARCLAAGARDAPVTAPAAAWMPTPPAQSRTAWSRSRALALLLVVVAAGCVARAALIALAAFHASPPASDALVTPEATAGSAAAEPAAPPAILARGPTPAAAIAPAAGPPGGAEARGAGAEALLEVARELKMRRERIEARERDVEAREVALGLVGDRLDARIGQLDALRRELEALLGRLSAEDEARIDRLVKIYEAMKADRAAVVFDSMDLVLLLPVAKRMREAKLAAIVEEMDPARARAITLELAKPKELPRLRAPTAATGPPVGPVGQTR